MEFVQAKCLFQYPSISSFKSITYSIYSQQTDNSRNLCLKLILVLVTTTSPLIIGQAAGADPPVPDDCKARPFEDGLALDCALSAINSADEKTNFSVLPAQHTRGLTIRCRDPALSQLEADGLRRLVKANKSKKRVTWSENSLRLCCVDQSGASIQILPEPRHTFFIKLWLYWRIFTLPKEILQITILSKKFKFPA